MSKEDVNPGGNDAGTQDQDVQAGDQGIQDRKPELPEGSWLKGLPEDIRENSHLTRYKSPEEAARGLIEAQNFISSSRPTVPKEDAPPEEWDKFYNSLGRPEKPEGYKIAKPENLPEGFAYSEEIDQQWQVWAHQAGLTAKQFTAIREAYLTANVANFKEVLEQQGQREKQVTEVLEKEWKGKYRENLDLARKTAQRYIQDGADWEALAFALNNDERLVRIFCRMGQDLSEDTLRGGGTGRLQTSFKNQAEAKTAELIQIDYRKEPQRYKDVKAEVDELFKKAEAAGELT